MDIKCKHCGEPWDMDELHDMFDGEQDTPVPFDEARKRFYSKGCEAFGTLHNADTLSDHDETGISILQELMDDDIDGLAALTEDLGL